MTKYEVHNPDPAPYHEKHKPGKRVYIAGRITGAPAFQAFLLHRRLHPRFSGIRAGESGVYRLRS